MKTVQKSVLIWYSPEEMFALVTGVEHYPQFLPWCDRSAVLEQTEDGMTAEVGIALGGIRQTFVTRNTHEAGRRVQMHLVRARSRAWTETGTSTPWAMASSAPARWNCS